MRSDLQLTRCSNMRRTTETCYNASVRALPSTRLPVSSTHQIESFAGVST